MKKPGLFPKGLAYVERVGRVLQEKVPKRKERPAHCFKGVTGLCTLKRLAPG